MTRRVYRAAVGTGTGVLYGSLIVHAIWRITLWPAIAVAVAVLAVAAVTHPRRSTP